MKFIIGFIAVLFLITTTLFLQGSRDVTLVKSGLAVSSSTNSRSTTTASTDTTVVEATTTISKTPLKENLTVDLPNQTPLPNPPSMVKGLYVSAWSAGSLSRVNYLIDFAKKNGINAMVVDIKDYSGHVSYATGIPEVRAAHADQEIRIAKPNALIAKLHENNIYVIGRVTVFQDPLLAIAHPEWAFKNKTTGKTWVDSKGLAWMDPATQGVWDYDISIAKNALDRGFDEINFDYVRFASDGTLGNISYPSWDGKTPRQKVIKNFFSYLRSHLVGAKISADLFGLSTVNHDDLGIGQVIENAYPYFDYISPMVYPSHYASGFLGFKNPADHPYEVINYSLTHAYDRLLALINPKATSTASSTPTVSTVPLSPDAVAKLRPWIQVFDLGAIYDKSMIMKEIEGASDAFRRTTSTPDGSAYYNGWLLWDPKNDYSAAKGVGL